MSDVEDAEFDAAGNETKALSEGLTEFDVTEMNAGRITGRMARFQAALAYVKALAGHDEEDTD